MTYVLLKRTLGGICVLGEFATSLEARKVAKDEKYAPGEECIWVPWPTMQRDVYPETRKD